LILNFAEKELSGVYDLENGLDVVDPALALPVTISSRLTFFHGHEALPIYWK
jgi:hypothetical protein